MRVGAANLHFGGMNPHRSGEPYDLGSFTERFAAGLDVAVFPETFAPDSTIPFGEVTEGPLSCDMLDTPDRFVVPAGMTSLFAAFGPPRPRPYSIVGRAEPSGTLGVRLLTGLKVCDVKALRLPKVSADMHDRTLPAVLLDHPLGEIWVVGVHVSSLVPYGPVRHLHTLRRMLPAGELVLAGDFNLWGPPAALLTGLSRCVRGRTWPSHRPAHQIDHIMSRALRPLSSCVGPAFGSDHLPVSATLTG